MALNAHDLDAMTAVAEVDLGALVRNAARLQAAAPSAQLLVAVKADAYGHGLVPVARALEAANVAWFGVATPQEALDLRAAGIRCRILIFGPQRGRPIEQLLDAEVDLTVTTLDDLEAVKAAVRGGPGRSARVHLKVDTGMGRLGLPANAALPVAHAAEQAARIRLEGVWTHFARSDEPDATTTDDQLEHFDAFLADLARHGLTPPLRHAANSAALLTRPDTHFDLVRPGIAAYGCPPVIDDHGTARSLEPVLRVHAPVVFTKRVAAETPISYGHRWRARRETTIATVRFGYGDGYPRALTNLGDVDVGGRTCRVVGTVCMDQLMIDVGDEEVEVGERVTVLGAPGPSANDLANRIGSISYELLTRLGARVTRRHRTTPSG